MSDFPLLKTGAVLQYPFRRATRYSTCVLRFVDGSEQRFRDYGAPLRRWIIRLEMLDDDEMARLEDFFRSRQGRAGSFRFTDPLDGIEYADCSLESDSVELSLQDIMRGQTALVVRQNRS